MNTDQDRWERIRARYETKPIRLGLERVRRVVDALGLGRPEPVCITVAGTNGKGSTCAMVEAMLRAAGYRVGRYTSPHLVSFRERILIDGEPVGDAELADAFEAVAAADTGEELSAFEMDTVVALQVFRAQALDALVLEVGLGGRLDAVNVIDADAVVITSIDLDHVEYLGPDRESIGREKAHVMRAGRPAIVSDPVPPQSVIEHAQAIGADLWLVGRDYTHQGDRQQWGWSGRGRRYSGLGYPALRGANQLINAAGAIAVLQSLRERLPVAAQAIRTGLATVDLPGRFQIVPGQPVLVLDVAHNPQSVAALALNLDQMGFYPRTHAVFGAMQDKDLAGALAHVAPLVDAWYLTALPTPRAATPEALRPLVEAAAKGRAVPVQSHADPAAALAAALEAADPADRIVVFGSFYTVGGVLKNGLPRLGASHVG